LLLLGLFTRAAGLLLALEMCVAIWKVHSAHGYLAVSDYQFRCRWLPRVLRWLRSGRDDFGGSVFV